MELSKAGEVARFLNFSEKTDLLGAFAVKPALFLTGLSIYRKLDRFLPLLFKMIPFKIISFITVVLFSMSAFPPQASAFERSEWNVRCWNSKEKLWEDCGLEKMTVVESDTGTKITNTSGIHKHAHLVFPAELKGDFTFTIELQGGYELGFLNRAGKDEMLYVELPEGEQKKFDVYTLSREGTRFSIARNGRVVSLVHHRFDYGEDFLITLAIKDGESAELRSFSLSPVVQN
jgi:hypothetical protein